MQPNPNRMSRRRRGALVAVMALAALGIACVPPPPPAPTTTTTLTGTTPVVLSFNTPVSTAVIPALVPLRWNVADPQNSPLTCRFDVGDDGTEELVVAPCNGARSRNVVIDSTGPTTVRITVVDASESATATLGFSAVTGPSETYDIVLRAQGPVDPAIASIFIAAEARWESVLAAGVPASSVNVGANVCGATNGVFSGTVDDLLIDYSTTAIDGVGGVLARAGPCLIDASDRLPRFGVMEFDSADLAGLASIGLLDDVIVHEMAHVLGYGTVWDLLTSGTLLSGSGSGDPRYNGPRGIGEWSALGGAGAVPVEATGGPGTADSHWRETTFDNELMTGFIDYGTNPLSRLTIASLADLGYRVNIGAADPYVPPAIPSGLAALRISEGIEINTVHLGPIGTT